MGVVGAGDVDGKMRGRRVARQKGGKRRKKREKREGKNERREEEKETGMVALGIGVS